MREFFESDDRKSKQQCLVVFYYCLIQGTIMKLIRTFALAALAAASVSSMAATDGVADAAQSVATYTNTFGTTPAVQIRVFGVQDALMTSNAPSVPSFFGVLPGVEDKFCVAHSTGASVTLRFTSAGLTEAASGNSAIATSATTGAKLVYHPSVGKADFSDYKTIASADNVYVAAAPQTDLTTCAAPGFSKSVILPGGAQGPATDVLTDLVTITATLN